MISAIIAFLVTPLGRIAAAVMVGLAFWGFVKFHYEAKGAEKQIARTEKANAAVLSRADRVRAKSTADGVRGVVDPNYID